MLAHSPVCVNGASTEQVGFPLAAVAASPFCCLTLCGAVRPYPATTHGHPGTPLPTTREIRSQAHTSTPQPSSDLYIHLLSTIIALILYNGRSQVPRKRVVPWTLEQGKARTSPGCPRGIGHLPSILVVRLIKCIHRVRPPRANYGYVDAPDHRDMLRANARY